MARNEIAPERLEKVREYLRMHPTHGRRKVAAALSLPPASAERAIKELAKRGAFFRAKAASPREAKIKSMDENAPSMRGFAYDAADNTACAVVETPTTVDQLLDACKVDRTRWVVDRFIVNTWQVGAKQDDGSVSVTPLYQIKVWLVKAPGLDEADALRETIEWIRKNSPVAKHVAKPVRKVVAADPHMLEISIPDLHHGKLTWSKENGEDYDTTISASLHQQAVEALWARSAVFPIEKILFVTGSDFFNVNSMANATAAGTPQQEDGRWAKTFRSGLAVMQRAIEFLRGKAPGGVEVRVIRGNHDSERVFMAGEVLAAMYADSPDVTIVNDPMKRQYVQWGATLLGITHGDGAKLDKLPLIMAGEAPAMWAATTHREIHVGHLHHKRETQFHVGNEHGPVRVRVLPSLSTADDWHYSNGFVCAQRAAEAYLWSHANGYSGHFSWSPAR